MSACNKWVEYPKQVWVRLCPFQINRWVGAMIGMYILSVWRERSSAGPGIVPWRRALTVNQSSLFARFSWDLHSALGVWNFLFVLMWGVS